MRLILDLIHVLQRFETWDSLKGVCPPQASRPFHYTAAAGLFGIVIGKGAVLNGEVLAPCTGSFSSICYSL